MKKAVLLMNMGGPGSLKEVRSFLFRLFCDPAIIRLPGVFRYFLAHFISLKRTKEARHIYEKLGGRSPLLENTQKQAKALEQELSTQKDVYRVFVGMSYTPPMISQTMEEIKKEGCDEIILLPLYPQYSTTTTASALRDAKKAIKKCKMKANIKEITHFPTDEGFVAAFAEGIKKEIMAAQKGGEPTLLFSAHGLPMSIVESGDPYPQECAETVQALCRAIDWPAEKAVLCYQSRVGRLKWLEPATDQEIDRAAKEKRPLLVVPIAFVSDHSETLYELGMLNKKRALDQGCPYYGVVSVPGTHRAFIKSLAAKIAAC